MHSEYRWRSDLAWKVGGGLLICKSCIETQGSERESETVPPPSAIAHLYRGPLGVQMWGESSPSVPCGSFHVYLLVNVSNFLHQ